MLPFATLLFTIVAISEGARILGIVPTPSYSHQVVFHPIWKELSKRGHQVVLLTTDPIRDSSLTNLHEIDLSGAYDIWNRLSTEVIKKSKNPFSYVREIHGVVDAITIFELSHPEVQRLINNKTEHFDVVMAEFFIPTTSAFKHRFNCPLIGMTSAEARTAVHRAVGNTIHHVLYPEPYLPFGEQLNFFQRLVSLLFSKFFEYHARLTYIPRANAMIEKYFGKPYPDLEEIRDSVDLILTNTNLVYNHVRPITPATIMIGGGIHIKEPKELPQDLKQYLDDAREGLIYFSLGSNVKSKDIPIDIRDKIKNALSELPYKVLWKFESEELPERPANIKLMKWIPQQDVLRHKNTKAFITQGGLQSLEEALFANVPVIGMPFFSDQESNIMKVQSKGLGLRVDFQKMTSEEFKDTILEVVNNPKYKTRAKELASLIKDEPMTGLEKAVWWTEYVIRNKGAQHLKGPGANMPLYQYYYLDVIVFVTILLITILYCIYFIVKKLCKCCFGRKVKME